MDSIINNSNILNNSNTLINSQYVFDYAYIDHINTTHFWIDENVCSHKIKICEYLHSFIVVHIHNYKLRNILKNIIQFIIKIIKKKEYQKCTEIFNKTKENYCLTSKDTIIICHECNIYINNLILNPTVIYDSDKISQIIDQLYVLCDFNDFDKPHDINTANKLIIINNIKKLNYIKIKCLVDNIDSKHISLIDIKVVNDFMKNHLNIHTQFKNINNVFNYINTDIVDNYTLAEKILDLITSVMPSILYALVCSVMNDIELKCKNLKIENNILKTNNYKLEKDYNNLLTENHKLKTDVEKKSITGCFSWLI